MSKINKQQVINVLSSIKDLDGKSNVIESKTVDNIVIKDNKVGFTVQAQPDLMKECEQLRSLCEKKIKESLNVEKVLAVLTSEKLSKDSKTKEGFNIRKVNGVKKIICVASGKGGVGKSTIALNLALSLKAKGLNVGILDADIYGPSIAYMMQTQGVKPKIDSNNLMIPIKSYGLQTISSGNLVDPKKAAVWRGPMATKALFQLFIGTAWDNLDYLIVDMPPGTGDIQLSIAKNFVIDGAILVSTPHQLAIIDVIKAKDMFDKLNIPIIGLIENMSYFDDPISNNRNYIFGKNNAKIYAEDNNINFLGEIAINSEKDDNKKEQRHLDCKVFDSILIKLSNS